MAESEIIPINDYDSNLESETDSEISINDSGSIDSFSDNFDFDISDDENDDLSQARNFYEIDFNNPSAPPRRFAFTNTPEIHLDFDASSGTQAFLLNNIRLSSIVTSLSGVTISLKRMVKYFSTGQIFDNLGHSCVSVTNVSLSEKCKKR
ncbi:hypothetical protein TNCV_2391911 [Trichonephila clavipes]|nr:hypothetical protein TNCV_2391911 [Trichonephila clavipes]